MRALKVLVASCIMAAAAVPAFADDMMAPTMGMMRGTFSSLVLSSATRLPPGVGPPPLMLV